MTGQAEKKQAKAVEKDGEPDGRGEPIGEVKLGRNATKKQRHQSEHALAGIKPGTVESPHETQKVCDEWNDPEQRNGSHILAQVVGESAQKN